MFLLHDPSCNDPVSSARTPCRSLYTRSPILAHRSYLMCVCLLACSMCFNLLVFLRMGLYLSSVMTILCSLPVLLQSRIGLGIFVNEIILDESAPKLGQSFSSHSFSLVLSPEFSGALLPGGFNGFSLIVAQALVISTRSNAFRMSNEIDREIAVALEPCPSSAQSFMCR